MTGVEAESGLRFFGAEEIRALTPPPERCCELASQALRWLAAGEIEVPAKFGVHPRGGRHVHAMPAYCKPLEVIALKWVADFPSNRARGLPTISALILLNDGKTGVPYAVMDGNWITATRTAAMTAVSLAACASRSETLALVGTGLEARTHLQIVPAALPSLRKVHLVGRTRAAAEKFVAANPTPLHVEIYDDVRSAVRAADVIVTVTNQMSEQLVEPEWLARGATIAFIDNPAKERAVLEAADRIVVDDRKPFETDDGRARFKNVKLRIDAEIGHVLLGNVPGRTSSEELVAIANLGNAALDVVFADDFYRRAVAP